MPSNGELLAIDMRDWVAAFRFANLLLREERRVYLVMRALRPGRPSLPPGALLIDPEGDDELGSRAERLGVALTPVEASGAVVHELSPVRIALYGGGGAPFNHAAILAAAGFRLDFLSDVDVIAGELDRFDIFVMPGGGFRAMHGQLEPLGLDGAAKIADWVRRGGMYIGSCAGAYDCAITSESFIQSCPPKGPLQLINARVWNDESVDLPGLQSPGVGEVIVRNARPDHPVMFGMPETFPIVHYNGPVFEALGEQRIPDASLASELAIFVGAGAAFTHAEAFMGAPVEPGKSVLDRAIATGRASIVAGGLGAGRVVAFGSHPEFGFDLAMSEWGAPARMFANAALWQSAARRSWNAVYFDQDVVAAPGATRPRSVPAGAAYDAVESAAVDLAGRARALAGRAIDPPPRWLTADYAMSFFAESPASIWTQSLADIERHCALIQELTNCLRERTADASSPAAGHPHDQIDAWLLDSRDPAWRQDGGYLGVLALLEAAIEMCDDAAANWENELGPPAGPYAYFDGNPYQLVVGSYLAAIGCAVGATQLLRALNDEVALHAECG